MPDPFGLPMVPNTIWNDEFQAMGGVNIEDLYAQQQAARQAQAAQYAEQQAAQQVAQQAEADAAQQAQRQQALEAFVDWGKFQQLTEGTEPMRQYDGYLGALEWQLREIGYPEEEVQAAVAKFQREVPRPGEDKGIGGNLWDSMTGGYSSGMRALAATAAATTDNKAEIARLAAESAGMPRNAAQERFQQALARGEAAGDDSWWSTAKTIASAGTSEFEGLLNFMVEQVAQSAPVMAATLASAAAGTAIGGPVGTVGGMALGAGTGSTALDVGSTILDGVVTEARKRGLDPKNPQALLTMLNDPVVKDQIVSEGWRHGIPVGAMDAALAAVSFGVGSSARRSLEAGRRARALGKAAGGVALESAGAGYGEYLGEVNAGQPISKMNIGMEMLGEGLSGTFDVGMGAVMGHKPVATPTPVPTPTSTVTPPVTSIPPVDLTSQEDIEANLNAGNVPPVPPAPPATPATAVTTAEQAITTAAAAPAPTLPDMNDRDAVRDWLSEQGVPLYGGVDVENLIDIVTQAPDDRKRDAIAEVLDQLPEMDSETSEPMANALLRLSRAMPGYAEHIIEQETVQPGESLLNTIRRVTGQRSKADRRAEEQAWAEHFAHLVSLNNAAPAPMNTSPNDVSPEVKARRVAIADAAWKESEKAARLESLQEASNYGADQEHSELARRPIGAVTQRQLDTYHRQLDAAVAELGRRRPAVRGKLRQLRDRAAMLMEETIHAHNERTDELPAAGGGGAGAGRGRGGGAGAGVAGGLTRGGRSSGASFLSPLHYKYLNEKGGRKDVATSIGATYVAEYLGVDPSQVVPLVTAALAQDIAIEITEQGAEHGIEKAIRAPTSEALGVNLTPGKGVSDPTLERAAQRELIGLKRRDTSNVERRGLRPGERVPDIIAGQRGLIEAADRALAAKERSGGGVRTGLAEEGAGVGGSVAGEPGAADRGSQGGVGGQSDNTAGNRGVSRRLKRGSGKWVETRTPTGRKKKLKQTPEDVLRESLPPKPKVPRKKIAKRRAEEARRTPVSSAPQATDVTAEYKAAQAAAAAPAPTPAATPTAVTPEPRLVEGRGYTADEQVAARNRLRRRTEEVPGGELNPAATIKTIAAEADAKLKSAEPLPPGAEAAMEALRASTAGTAPAAKKPGKIGKKKKTPKLSKEEQARVDAINATVAESAKGTPVAPGEDRIAALKDTYESKYGEQATAQLDADVDELLTASAGSSISAEAADAPAADAALIGQTVPRDLLFKMQDMSATEILTYIANTTDNPLARVVARELAHLKLPTVFRLRNMRSSAGYYYYAETPDGKTTADHVLIDPDRPRGPSLTVILHEFVHAATMLMLDSPKTDQQRAAAKAMKELYEFVKQKYPDAAVDTIDSPLYGLKNVGEFVAEALSNPRFQDILKSITMPGPAKITAWTAFKKVVFDLLGLNRNDALSHVFAGVEDLFTAARGDTLFKDGKRVVTAAAAAPTTSAQRGATVPSMAILGVTNGVRTFIAYPKSKTDPNTTYSLYPVTPGGDQRGDATNKKVGLTRAQVDAAITAAGATPLEPIGNTVPNSGTPTNSASKRVGYASNGDPTMMAFKQKDGTWTFYQSDSDVRSDPYAKKQTGLTQTQVDNFITGRGLTPTAPTPAAVQPGASTPTDVGYRDASWVRTQIQDSEAALKKFDQPNTPTSQRIDVLANSRNSRSQAALKQNMAQYVEPARKAGEAISKRFGKPEAVIMKIMQDMHIAERAQKKIEQLARGNMDAATQATKRAAIEARARQAESELNAANASNPQLVTAIRTELAPKIKAMADNTVDLSAQYGLITRETAESIKAAYDFYIPFQTGDKTSTGKAATGSSWESDRAFQRMVEQLQRTIARGEQNSLRRMVTDIVEQGGRILNLNDKTPGAGSVLAKAGESKVWWDPATNSLNEGSNSHTFDDNAIDVYIDGQRHRYVVTEPSLLTALHPYKGAQRQTMITVAAALGARINHLIAMGKTALSPGFAIFNVLRDIMTANINMPPGISRLRFNMEMANPLTWTAALDAAARNIIGLEPGSKTFRQAQEAHSFISHRSMLGLDATTNDVNAMFRPTKRAQLKWLRSKTFDALSLLAQVSESAPRLAVYKAAMARAQQLNMSPADAKAYAGNAAKTTTVNFEQRGESNLSNFWIFGNAKMQGLAAIGKSAQRMGAPKAIAGLVGLTLLGLLTAKVGGEGEKDKDGKAKYTKIPTNKKDTMILWKEGSYGIPLSQEIAPWYVLGNALGEYMTGEVSGTDAASRAVTSFMNNYLPASVPQQEIAGHKANVAEFLLRSLVPTYALPAVDLGTGKNTFGSEIVRNMPDKLKRGIPKPEMGDPTEAQLAVNLRKNGLMSQGPVDTIEAMPTVLAEFTNMAPQQIKLLNNYFNPLAEGYSFLRDMTGNREEKYEGDIVNPIARRFTGKAAGFYDQDKFDELLARSTQAKHLATTKGIANLPPEEQALARSADMLSRVDSDIRTMFSKSRLMSKEQRELRQERAKELVQQGISRYNQMLERTQ